MAVLKQNGDNGKIMRAQGSGKVLKQNYNISMSASFKNGVFCNVKLPATGVNVESGFSFYAYLKNRRDLSTAKMGFLSIDDQNAKGVSLSINEQDAVGSYYLYFNSQPQLQHNNSLIFTCFSGAKTYVNENGYNVDQANNPTSIQRIIIGKSSYYSFGVGDVVNQSDVQIAELVLFTRPISESEVAYKYNQGIGNDDLNTSGIYCKLMFIKAEILDFSDVQDGSDLRVGIRDFSGNNYHGEIEGLPSGTIQEQVDYANVNIFEKW